MKKNSLYAMALLCAAGSFSAALVSCSDSKDEPTDVIANAVDTLYQSNLVAHFPFEDETPAVGAGEVTLVKNQSVTFSKARRGKGYQGAADGYVQYALTAESRLKTLKAFTLSAWVRLVPNEPNLKNEDGSMQEERNAPEYWLVFIDGANSGWEGNFFLKQNRNMSSDGVNVDTSSMSFTFRKDGVDWANQSIGGLYDKDFKYNTWMHVTATYDNVTSKFRFYRNGTLLADLTDGSATYKAGTVERWQHGDENDPRLPLGDMNFNGPQNLIFGALAKAISGEEEGAWCKTYYKGGMDEVRIYDRALTQAEVNALYLGEVSAMDE